MATDRSKLENLNLSSEELSRFSKALKDEEFRKLFVEYANEISDPENRKRYEEEIAQMERERGMDVKFVHPQPGYVMKTTVDGQTKAFINIAKNDNIEKPTSRKAQGPSGNKGLQWFIPHSFSQPRDDTDKAGNKCKVFDVVFHPDTYRMAESNARFKQMVSDTAMDGIEKQFGVKLDRKNIKYPKMKFKGVAPATVIRSKNENSAAVKKEENKDDLMNKFPYPYGEKTSEEKTRENEEKIKEKQKKEEQNMSKTKKLIEELPESLSLKNEENEQEKFQTPKYTIVHRSPLDLQEFTQAPDAKTSTRPKELVISIELPLLKSASTAGLDISEKRLVLESQTPAAYKLDIELPYAVDEELGTAKFDKSKRKLVVTLPVIQPKPVTANGDLSYEPDNGLIEEVCKVEADAEDPEINDGAEKTENGSENDTEDDPVETPDSISPLLMKDLMSPDVMYTFPPDVTNLQDLDSLSFIAHVASVRWTSVKSQFSLDGKAFQVVFTSIGSGGFPRHYSMCVVAHDEDRFIHTENCVNVSEENVVICLMKSASSSGIWEKCHLGLNADTAEELVLLTEERLAAEIDALELGSEASMVPHPNETSLEVTEMNQDQLLIHVKGSGERPLRTERSVRRHYSESEIEVVHEQDMPKLHGILKQRSRTLSDSSDDALANSFGRQNSMLSGYNGGSESPISESEECSEDGRRKSVSFSETIDSASYKTNSSVTQLHNTLKNKRKRAKKQAKIRDMKKEQKLSRRQRTNSGSSELSSGDDGSTHTDETDENCPPNDENVITQENMIKQMSEARVGKTSKKNKGKKAKKNGQVKSDSQSSTTESSEDIKETTSVSCTQEEIESSEIETGNIEKAPSEKSAASKPTVKGTKDKKDSENISICQKERENSVMHKSEAPSEGAETKPECKGTSETVEEEVEKPDTILSWKETPDCGEQKVAPSCTLGLTNSLMYELDDD